MTKKLVKVVPLPKRAKLISEMTHDEISQYASDLIDGGCRPRKRSLPW